MIPNLKSQYETDGYCIARQAIDADLAQETAAHVHWLLANHPDVRGEQLHHALLRDDPFMWRLAGDERLLNIASQFIGQDVALFAAHYIAKQPFTGQKVLWHQDGSYWPLEPMEVVTIWLAATDSMVENGCMRILPNTQNMTLASWDELRKFDDGDNVLGSGLDPRTLDESSAIDIQLKAGDASIHNPNIIHGSNENVSDKWRIGLTLRYIPTTTKVLNPEIGPMLLRGKAIEGINEYWPRPRYVAGTHFPFKGAENL
jgi:hypothetical protein